MQSLPRLGLLAVSSLLLTGCAGAYSFAPNTGLTYPAKPSDCNLYVVDSWSYPGYVEIGIVEPTGGGSGYPVGSGSGYARTQGDFYKMIRKPVCEAGGDVVVSQVNGLGVYIRGIVLRKVDASPMMPPVQALPPTPAATPPGPQTIPVVPGTQT